MRLLLVRHARAGDREEFARTGLNDDQRPLAERGRVRMRRGLQGLRRTLPRIEVFASSPLVRAWQPAELFAEAYPLDDIARLDSLRPDGRYEEFADWLGTVPKDATVAVVGHRPRLCELGAWLLTGTAGPWLHMKKGGAILLESDPGAETPVAGAFSLRWALTPRQLPELA